jgi:hypothetical protein
MAGLGGGGEQAADLAGGETDQLAAVVIMLLGRRGTLSTGPGAMLTHLINIATDQGYRLLSLETGTMPGFAPARALYASAGFTACAALADYPHTPHSVFMSLALY